MAQSEPDTESRSGPVTDRADVTDSGSDHEVGKSVEKVDGRGLVTGEASYTDDVPTENALDVVVVRSPHAHARIDHIDTTEAEEIPGVRAILTHEDVPEKRFTRTGFPYPQTAPFDERVLDDKVRHVGDAVALIAAEDVETAEQARETIEIEYEVLDHVLEIDDALAADAPVIHDEDDYENPQRGADPESNVICEKQEARGDVDAGLEEADVVITESFSLKPVQQAPMEMNTTIARVDGRGRLVLRTSTQIPHLVRNHIARAFGLSQNDVQVIKPKVGGGFGVKQDVVRSQYYAAALALETGETVRIENSRYEDLHVAQTRHGGEIKIELGVTSDGSITAMRKNTTLNGGAYGCHTTTVLSVSGHQPLSCYPVDNIEYNGRGVYTNLPPGGAMRGYGAVQGSFALESAIDEAADAIGMDPLEFRFQNCIKEGDEAFEADYGIPPAGPLENVGLVECIERATDSIGWGDKTESDGDYRIGYGMAIGMMKSGVPGNEFAGAEITGEDDGTFTLRVGVGDAGQGAETTVAQIAASTLGVETEAIHVKADDTDAIPWDNGAYASSTTYVSGQAAMRAAQDAADHVREVATRWLAGDPDQFDLTGGDVVSPDGDRIPITTVVERAFRAVDGPQVRITGHGECNPNFSPRPFVAHVAKVGVDPETGAFDILEYVVAADCGFAINPENARGQLLGAAVMGLGQAVSEVLTFDEDGSPELTGLRDYDTMAATDIPDTLEAILVEPYEETGPYGAKSVAEVGNNGPPAAVANAVADAVAARVTELPITADKITAGRSDEK